MSKLFAKRAWVNVMEFLVAEEIERQLSQLSVRKQPFLKPEEIMTYALNRLDPLYANSTRGLEMQEHKARQQMMEQVRVAVRRGIAAVERDPLRHSTPIDLPSDAEAELALQRLRSMLGNPKLTWDSLPTAVESALKGTSPPSKDPWQRRSPGRSPGNFNLSQGNMRPRH